jgi:hypothetical protein
VVIVFNVIIFSIIIITSAMRSAYKFDVHPKVLHRKYHLRTTLFFFAFCAVITVPGAHNQQPP